MDIKKILNIEIAIAGIYNQLFKMEFLNDLESEKHAIYKRQLLVMLDKEDEMLSGCTIEQLYTLEEKIENIKIDVAPNNLFADNVTNRLKNKLNKLLDLLFVKEMGKEEYNTMLENCILLSLVEFEKADIYLSFVDEKINNTVNYKEKLPLILEKYMLISALDTDNIKRLSQRNFQTEKSVYLDSLLYTANYKCSDNVYLKIKSAIALDNIKKINIDIVDGKITSKTANIEIIFRTMMLLLNKEEYEKITNYLYNNNELLSKYIEVFGKDILETLNKDRQRHKTLYLKR